MSGSGCTNFSPTCTIVQSYYAYIPSLSTNAAYAGIFGLSFGIHAVQGLIWRKAWLGFALAMSIGNIGKFWHKGHRLSNDADKLICSRTHRIHGKNSQSQ